VELAPGHCIPRDHYPKLLVSILVFVELAPGLCHKFQHWGALGGFNPCFCGTRARTAVEKCGYDWNPEFQSLFLWNSRPDILNVGVANMNLRFQSLFLWNSRPDSMVLVWTLRRVAFQSLFLWNSRPDSI